jgi:hypothetical protein
MRTHPLRSRSRRLAVLLAAVTAASLAPAAAQAAPAASAAAPSDVALNLSVIETPGATARKATLRCRGSRAVARGYLSEVPAKACRQARALERFLLSTPDPNRICTDIFGGPQTAKVTGSVDGRRVQRSSFSRRNGCEIADWDTMGLLLSSAIGPSRLLAGSAVSPSRLLVAYHRTGGFAGLDDRLSVTRNGRATRTARDGVPHVFQLRAADLRRLERALQAADFPSLEDEYLPEFPVSDGFTYTLTHRNKTVVTADGAVPAALKTPIAVLDRLLAGPPA